MSSSSLASCLEPGGRSLVEPPSSSHSALGVPVYRSPRHDHLTPVVPGIGVGVYTAGTYPKGQGYYSACSGDATAALYSRVSLDLYGYYFTDIMFT